MDDKPKAWPAEVSRRLGKAIGDARTARNMSALKLAEATDVVGASVHRVAIPRIEKGAQAVTVPELIALGVALDADWTGWLITAVDGLDIAGERDQRFDLRAVLVDITKQLDIARHNLFQAEEGPKRLRMPDVLKEKMGQDAQRYREMVENLESHRALTLKLLDEQSDA